MFTASFVVLLLAAYLVGAIPCGVILTRFAGVGDVRQSGSGNIGATNVYRVAGKGLGIATLLGDALKGVLPVLLAKTTFGFTPEQVALIAMAAFLGHCYPVYLGFKGGKGVATALGIFLVLSPLAVLCAVILFAAILWYWRYVSLGSIMAATAMPFLILFLEHSLPFLTAALFIGVIVILRHSSNIRRLLDGTESRFRA